MFSGTKSFKTLNLLSPKNGTSGYSELRERLLMCKDFQSEYVLLVQRLASFGLLIGVWYSVCNNLLCTLSNVLWSLVLMAFSLAYSGTLSVFYKMSLITNNTDNKIKNI